MTNKLVKVINNKDRYFNGARKGGILEVEENRINYYLQNGFSLVKEIEEKKNITQIKKIARTKKELIEILDHNGITYDKKSKVGELEILVQNFSSTEDEISTEDKGDIETLKIQLVEQAIVISDELEGKSNDEITQIATDNGLI